MSLVRGYPNKGNLYSNLVGPVKVDMSFAVTSTNGLGITSLKSNGYVNNVFMHTSISPTSNNGVLNPNPAAGYALVQMKNNFNKFIGMHATIAAPVTGSALNINTTDHSLVVGTPYQITVLGNATSANWSAVGVMPGFTPSVGMVFIAKATGAGASTSSKVKALGVSGISSIEVIGDSNQLIANSSIAVNHGSVVLVQFLAGAFSGSALAAHNHNLIVKGGQAASTTNDIANYAGPLLGKQEATDATYVGANSATQGGVVGSSGGTPVGSISYVATAPTDSSIVSLSMYYDNSSMTIDGL